MRVPHVMLTCVQNSDDVMNRRLAKEMSPWKVPNILRMLSGAPSDHVTFVRNVGTMYVEFFFIKKDKSTPTFKNVLESRYRCWCWCWCWENKRTREYENTTINAVPSSLRVYAFR